MQIRTVEGCGIAAGFTPLVCVRLFPLAHGGTFVTVRQPKGHMKTKILATLLMAAAMIGLNAAEMPKTGDKAPDFTAQDQDGNTVKLSDYSGKQAVLLYFYPKDNTPGCTKEACGFVTGSTR